MNTTSHKNVPREKALNGRGAGPRDIDEVRSSYDKVVQNNGEEIPRIMGVLWWVKMGHDGTQWNVVRETGGMEWRQMRSYGP